MEPDHYRQVFGVFRHGDVQVKGVFTHAPFVDGFQGRVLCGLIGPGGCLPYAIPWLGRDWRLPAQFSHRRLTVRYTEKLPGVFTGRKPAKLATAGRHDLTLTLTALKMLARVARFTGSAGPRVQIREGIIVLKSQEQRRYPCPKVARFLIKLDNTRLCGYPGANGI